MGVGCRVFFFDEQGFVKKVPLKKFERIHRGEQACPEFAEREVRSMNVFIEFENRIPVEVLGAECKILQFDQEGFHNFQKLLDLASIDMDAKLFRLTSSENVVPFGEKYVEKELQKLQWEPTEAEWDQILDILEL